MDDQDSTYAPQSPDLSGYQFDPEPESAQRSYHGRSYRTSMSQPPPPYGYYEATSPYATVRSRQPSYAQGQGYNPYANHVTSPAMTRQPQRRESTNEDAEWLPDASSGAVTAKGKKTKAKNNVASDTGRAPAPGVAEGIDVKTKFPVARIKRIMQADEDVGKVAQVTPVVVSKALELFMISLVTKSAGEAKMRGSKKVTASHLKQAVNKDDLLDFLTDIVSKVPDVPPPQTGKHEDNNSDDVEPSKKKGRAKRKKKEEGDF